MMINKKLKLTATFFLAIILLMSQPASATFEIWDSATPWGGATPSYFAGWNVWDSVPTDITPDVVGSGTGSFQTYLSNASLFYLGDVYGAANSITNTAYNTSLTNVNPLGFYDVYVRMETIDTNPFTMANLNNGGNWLPATSTITFVNNNSLPVDTEVEQYWVWNNVAAPANATFFIKIANDVVSNGGSNISISQYQIAAFTTAVPEPETYAMFLAGLSLFGFVAYKRRAKNIR
jgi:hypothetical protein